MPGYALPVSKPVVFGKFRLETARFTKGTWVVYQATEALLERPVELRLHGRLLLPGSEDERTFVRRMRELAALDHPNILSVLDFGVEGQKGYVTAIPRDSVSLLYLLSKSEVTRLDEVDRIRGAAGLAQALRTMHAAGMVHGAIASDTVFWDQRRGFPYFAWFPVFEDAATEFSGKVVPLPRGFEGVRADIYRLSWVLHELLAGAAPSMAAAPGGKSTGSRRLDSALEVVAEGLRSRAEEGWQSSEALALALEAVVAVPVLEPRDEAPDEVPPAGPGSTPDATAGDAARTLDSTDLPVRSLLPAPGHPEASPVTPGRLVAALCGVLLALVMVKRWTRPAGDPAPPVVVGRPLAGPVASPPGGSPRPGSREPGVAGGSPGVRAPATSIPAETGVRPPPPILDLGPAIPEPLRRLHLEGPTTSETFDARWRRLETIVMGRAPGERRVGLRQLVDLRTRFRRQPQASCRILDHYVLVTAGK